MLRQWGSAEQLEAGFGPSGKEKPSRKKRCYQTFLEILQERSKG